MVTEKIQSWSARIIGPLVVASVLGLGWGWINLWRISDKLSADIEYLKAEADEGKRFTLAMGLALTSRVKTLEAETSTHEERLDNHSRLQEHEGAHRRMNDQQRQIDIIAGQWRDHTSGTSGRINRLEQLEKTIDKMWNVINSHFATAREE